MIFPFPYSNLYNLNLDWMIKTMKEMQEIVEPLSRVVNSVNGMTGDVQITKQFLLQILESMVSKFNGRAGDVTLTAADVNSTMIDITWTSDPGDVIEDIAQNVRDQLYAIGKRVLIFVNNQGVPDQIYFLTLVGDVVTPQIYSPTAALAGVASFNGQTGAVTATGSDLDTASDDDTPISESIGDLQTAVGEQSQQITNLQNGLAIVSNGNTHAAIANGQFVYVKNNSTLAEGLYRATEAIPVNRALSTNNLTAEGSGGLNKLNEEIAIINSNRMNIVTNGNITTESAYLLLLEDRTISEEYFTVLYNPIDHNGDQVFGMILTNNTDIFDCTARITLSNGTISISDAYRIRTDSTGKETWNVSIATIRKII